MFHPIIVWILYLVVRFVFLLLAIGCSAILVDIQCNGEKEYSVNLVLYVTTCLWLIVWYL